MEFEQSHSTGAVDVGPIDSTPSVSGNFQLECPPILHFLLTISGILISSSAVSLPPLKKMSIFAL